MRANRATTPPMDTRNSGGVIMRSSGGSNRPFRDLLQKSFGGDGSYDKAATNKEFGWLFAISKKLSDASFRNGWEL
ncbi:hypothetical protein EVAR_62745_1 [Eumeta japonica]|uniref:Uncharacterized protein n=1 Tax=Eumeta variegata TaxID=151549 RepID=A0A4C1ZCV6_EUMVA|nr:hypothetical protein EVAR_62745_1 [Eumeta japonica]